MQNSTDILQIKKVFYSYGQHQVLRGVSFNINKGTVCGLLGPNGSGKTTLLKCINGLICPQTGEVIAEGRKVAAMTRQQTAACMALVPQQTTIVFGFTVLDIVVMGRAVSIGRTGLPGRVDYQQALETLGEVGVEYLAQRRFNELSGGEKQLVMLARAIFQNPRILLLDEPTAHLDFKNQFMVMEKVKQLTRQKGLTTVITIHDPNLASRYCDQVVLLKAGRIITAGLYREVFTALRLSEVYDMEVSIASISAGFDVVLPAEYICIESEKAL
ncbi:MAG: ABC transporter ATP-binding protein [Syntrophomonas sp.]